MIVPAPAGGGTDVSTRRLATLLEKELGASIAIMNIAGGGGSAGVTWFMSAKPDGYKLLATWNSPITTVPQVQPVTYDMNSFTPVASTSETAYTLCVKPDFPAKTGAEFLAALADNPGKYTYGNDGIPRYTFGEPWLLSGLDLIVILVGLYALPPVLQLTEVADLKGLPASALKLASTRFGPGELRRLVPTWLRSSLIGIGVGILPGAGGNIAAFLSYNAAKNADKDPESFGTGRVEGAAAAKNADNAASMVPALTLGIPGNVIAALVLGALIVHGLQPGPQLFNQNPGLVGGFMVQMLITSVLIFFVGGAAATRVFAQVQRLPGVLLVPAILVLMAVGVYVINGRTVDLWVMLTAELVGYVLEKVEVPLAPIILGLILGPMAEQNIRRALLLSRGDWTKDGSTTPS